MSPQRATSHKRVEQPRLPFGHMHFTAMLPLLHHGLQQIWGQRACLSHQTPEGSRRLSHRFGGMTYLATHLCSLLALRFTVALGLCIVRERVSWLRVSSIS